MEIKEILSEGLKRELEVVIKADEIQEKVDAKLVEVNKKAKVDGFRPGKAPIALMQEKFGESVKAEVMEKAVSEATQKAVEENKYNLASAPKIEDVSAEDDLKFKIKLEVLPEMPEVDFSTISLEKPLCKISEDEINEQIAEIKKHQVEYAKAEKTSEDKDQVVIDFLGKVDDVAFAGGEGKDHELILGSGNFIPGFEEQLIGKNVGDEVAVNVTFPDPYHSEELKGKDAVFDVTIKEVREAKPIEDDTELAKKLGVESIEKVRELITTHKQKEYDEITDSLVKKRLLDLLDEKCQFKIPQSMMDAEFNTIKEQLAQDPEYKDKSEEEITAEFTPIAERRVKLGIFLAELGKKENVEITPNEIMEGISKEVQMFPPDYQKQAIEYYRSNHEALQHIRGAILENKVIELVLEKVSVKDVEVDSKGLTDLAAEINQVA